LDIIINYKLENSPEFRVLIFQGKSYLSTLTKKGLGNILGDFFTLNLSKNANAFHPEKLEAQRKAFSLNTEF
jgi:hypothetical protein